MEKPRINLIPQAQARQVLGGNRSQMSVVEPAIIIAPLVGALIGAGTALLLAPQSGKRTQVLLQREGNRLKYQAGIAFSNLRNSVADMGEDARERISALQHDGKWFLSNRTSRVHDAVFTAGKVLKPNRKTPASGLVALAAPLVALLAVMGALKAKSS